MTLIRTKINDFYVVGDFNILSKPDSRVTRDFIYLNQSYGFALSKCNLPTRLGETRDSCIDHVITNRNIKDEITYVLQCDMPDHYMLSHVTSVLRRNFGEKSTQIQIANL